MRTPQESPDNSSQLPTRVGVKPIFPADVTYLGYGVTPAEELAFAFDFETEHPNSTPVPATQQSLPKIPGYQILGPLGRGGMGMVYAANHLRLDRRVALKILHPFDVNQKALQDRFTREVRALVLISHPNIVNVYDAGSWEGRPFFTMTLIRGGTLQRHSRRLHGDRRAICTIMAKIARAIAELHKAGVLHRDLKPQNILIDEHDEPFVADFGLALWLGNDSDLSVTNSPIGTRHYMPPEQTLGRKTEYAPSCDIWSLGVILYELLTAVWPFHHEDPVELYRQIRFDTPPPFSKYDATIPPALEAITRKCLAKRPEGRYASAEQLADDLERWLAGESILAPKLPPPRRAKRRIAAAVVVFAMFCAVGLAAAAWKSKAPEPSPVAKSYAEKLAAGETLELIGEHGLPLVATHSLPGREGNFETNTDGYAMLSTASEKAVEFSLGTIDTPVIFEGEVLLTRFPGLNSGAGLNFGMDKAQHNGKERFTVLRSFLMETPTLEIGSIQLCRWSTLTPARSIFDIVPPSVQTKPAVAIPAGEKWRRWRIRIRHGTFAADWDGRPFPPFTNAEIDRLYMSPMFGVNEKPVPPWHLQIGSSFGVSVENAELLFRNIRLIPDNPK